MSRASRAKKRKQVMPPVAEQPASASAEPKRTPTVRLVIRARIVPKAPAQPTRAATLRPTPAAIALAAVVLIAIVALTVRLLSDNSAPTSASNAAADSAAISDRTANTPPPAATASSDSAASSPQPAPPAASIPTSSVNEVVPDIPQSALQTIRGTIRVSIEVRIASDGTVAAASARIPGPSRYFERLALEAARKWTFTPSEQTARTQRVIFSFTRQGVSARWE